MAVRVRITSIPLMFLLLCSALLATTLQGVQGEVEVEGPSESECRPYIEKALKQLETGDTQSADVQDDDITHIVTTDDSDTQSGEAIESNEPQSVEEGTEGQEVEDEQNASERDTVENESVEVESAKDEGEIVQTVISNIEGPKQKPNQLFTYLLNFFNFNVKKGDKQEASGEQKAEESREQADAASAEDATGEAVRTKRQISAEDASPEQSETEEQSSAEDGASIEQEAAASLEEAESQTAEEASAEDGTASAEDGAASAEDGAASAEDGAASVEDGVASAEEGAASVEDGAASTEGAASAEEDAASAEDGGASAEDGAASAEDGAASVEDGAASVEDGAASAEDGAASVEDGAASAEDGAASIEDGAASTEEEGAASAEEGAASAEDGAPSVEESAASVEDGAASAEAGTASAEDGTASAEDGAASAEDGAASAEDGAASAEDDGASVEGAASTEEDGAASAEDGAASVEGAASAEEEGAASAEDGAASAEDGAASVEGAPSVEEAASEDDGAASTEQDETTEAASTEQEGEASVEGAASAEDTAEAASVEQEDTAASTEQEQADSADQGEGAASAEQEGAASTEQADEPASAEGDERGPSDEQAASVEEPSVEGEADSQQSEEAAEGEQSEEGEAESTPEEDLTWEMEIPSELRPREHINDILNLNDEPTDLDNLIFKAADKTLNDLKRIYENAIKPLETLYKYRDLSNRHFGDPEIFSKPLVLFMGPWSGGKSSIINYLLDNEYTQTTLRTGAEPSPAYFNILMHGEEPEILDGTQLAADWTFSGLQKFGQGLEERLRGLKLPNKLLEKINLVEIPGILEVRKQVSRMFPFNDACQWFIDRADIIFLVYDPSKLDVGPETEAILDQLKGREYQTRIILNKADQVKPEELMRVQGALIWNISPLMSSAQPPVMYSTSLWSRPYESGAPIRLLLAQERAFLRDLRTAVDKRIENKIASARRFAVRVRNHAKMVDCYLTTYYNHKSVFGNKKLVAEQIIEHPQDYHIYEGLSTLTNISRYDLPDPDVYRDFFRLNPLYDFQQLSATCTYFRGCPINRLDIAIAYDLPELVGKYKKMIEPATNNNNADSSTKS